MVVTRETVYAFIKQESLFIVFGHWEILFLSLNGYCIGQRTFFYYYFFCLRYASDNLTLEYSSENAIMENFTENPTWLSQFFQFPVEISHCH